MKDTKEKIANSDSEKVSGGAIWDTPITCAKCKKGLGPGWMGNFIRVDGTIYEPGRYFCKECGGSLTDAEKNALNPEDSAKVSGGAVWKVNCAKCGKEMIGGQGVSRVDGTGYEHPYFCEECAKSLTNAKK